MHKLLKKIKDHAITHIANKRIKNCKYVHLMFNDKFNKPFTEFLNRNFNQKEHLILCKRTNKQYEFPQGPNVIKISTLRGLNFKNCEKVICHSLFDTELVNHLYDNPDILKNKAHWAIWGGDLYNAPNSEKDNYVRKNCKGYIALIEGDEQVAKEKYKSSPITFYAPYTTPVSAKMLDEARKAANKNDFLTIQINNSSDATTLEMLDILKKFKNENIKITTILSYGNPDFKKQIIERGEELYEKNFHYIDKYMPAQDYAKHLANIDILILNQNRQQGVGNCTASAYLGKKIFIKSNITSYKYLQGLGIKIFDTHEIKNMDFKEFSYMDEELIAQNIENARSYYDESYHSNAWRKVFNNG